MAGPPSAALHRQGPIRTKLLSTVALYSIYLLLNIQELQLSFCGMQNAYRELTIVNVYVQPLQTSIFFLILYRLFDNDKVKSLVIKWVTFYKTYRDILTSDIIHVRRPDMQGIHS